MSFLERVRRTKALRLGVPFKPRKEKSDIKLSYSVKAPKRADLVFGNREDARNQKRAYAKSLERVQATIVQHEMIDGYIFDKEIS